MSEITLFYKTDFAAHLCYEGKTLERQLSPRRQSPLRPVLTERLFIMGCAPYVCWASNMPQKCGMIHLLVGAYMPHKECVVALVVMLTLPYCRKPVSAQHYFTSEECRESFSLHLMNLMYVNLYDKTYSHSWPISRLADCFAITPGNETCKQGRLEP